MTDLVPADIRARVDADYDTTCVNCRCPIDESGDEGRMAYEWQHDDITALIAILDKIGPYVGHNKSCGHGYSQYARICTCGYDQTLRGIRGESK